MAKDHPHDAPGSTRAEHPESPARPGRRSVDAVARARIGRELQRHYAQVLSMPIPDHLRTLLDDLAASTEREMTR
jgi:hypothetical protein